MTESLRCECHECTVIRWKQSLQGQMERAYRATLTDGVSSVTGAVKGTAGNLTRPQEHEISSVNSPELPQKDNALRIEGVLMAAKIADLVTEQNEAKGFKYLNTAWQIGYEIRALAERLGVAEPAPAVTSEETGTPKP